MPLCARCFSFYVALALAFALSFLFHLVYDVHANFLVVLTLLLVTPLVIDGITQSLRLRESNNKLRVLTGLMAGFVCGIDIHYLLINLSLLLQKLSCL